ncbi:NAD(P)-dependent oxidoreductase [Streptomyces californicus]|uniref:NAD(P)-dependent oxidoreductase n=1 Tax=Streptomyces californicus TaxID=67351 RepID=UPI0033C72983
MVTPRRPVALVLTGAADTRLLAQALPGWTVRATDSLDGTADIADPAAVRILVVRSGVEVGPGELDRLPRLADIIRAGSGLDGLDLGVIAARGIRVHRNPVPAADAVAEWALAATLSLARRIPLGHAALSAQTHLKAGCLTMPLTSARVAIWGAGPVGRATARALTGHAAEIAYAQQASIEPGLPQIPADELPGWADIHINALPHTSTTHRAFGPAFLTAAQPRRPLLVVVGRLATVDLPACVEALDNDALGGLALDPVDRQHMALLPRPTVPRNLLVTPHIGAQRTDVRTALDQWVADLAATLADASGPGMREAA